MKILNIKCDCGRIYTYDSNDTKNHTKIRCNSCNVNSRRQTLKDKALEYKGGKCQRCGYSKCKRAMSFHHRDKTNKDFSISASRNKSWEAVKLELDKCDLYCSNCHMEVEEELLNL